MNLSPSYPLSPQATMVSKIFWTNRHDIYDFSAENNNKNLLKVS